MPNSEHLSILVQGASVWNKWRDKNPEIIPDLADIAMWELVKDRNMQYFNLNKADLKNSVITGMDLRFIMLIEADLTAARLTSSALSHANLSHAKLVKTNMVEVDFDGALLTNVDMTGAIANSTQFGDLDLSTVKGLEKVEHVGPSTLGIDTLFRSQGKIPDVFLRGCGVPEIFIEYNRSLVGKSIQFFSCFISHSHYDQLFCERLYADLQANDVRVWYFPEDAKWGEPVWGEIDRSIKDYDKLIIVCSKHSLTSGPVLREIERALNREDKEGKNILFPITVDDYIFESWEHPRKADILAKVVGDFRGWNLNADKYSTALKKLLEALKLDK
ncbi:MAG: toll/interleukin-1 receptor domain-containing protein [Anaerolineales bacterium]|nr:toll/interleukin-1 receptor domain-containing protein [Anaerolineales bacterium]